MITLANDVIWQDYLTLLSNSRLLQTTKRLLIFPKREFILAFTETEQKKAINIGVLEFIPKGTLISSLVAVRLGKDIAEGQKDKLISKDKYVAASQDYFAYFSKVDGGTKLTVLTRVEMGSDIPTWTMRPTIISTVAWSLTSLKKLVENQQY